MQDMIDKYYADVEAGKPTSTYDLAVLIGEQPLEFHPGEGWCYSFCADVLGAVIEVITGKKYSDYLKETIFKPLGMVINSMKKNKAVLCRIISICLKLKPWNHVHGSI